MRISKNMEFGTDDEKALTETTKNQFLSADRYLCIKHLKDNVKHYLKNKVQQTNRCDQRDNIADEILEVLSMINDHPYVQTKKHINE
jgi:uncharacterized protein YegJ (DUF2314 family)